MKHLAFLFLIGAAWVARSAAAQTMTVQEIARLSSDSTFTLQGLGW